MSEESLNRSLTAVQEFRRARLLAKLAQVRAALSGKSADLLSYEDVRRKVNARETGRRELKEVPLDAIVGSVGRYKDFTREFFPLVDEDEARWARVRSLTESMEGLPPIEVYQLGDVYFVRDGNHRVSVARQLEASHIEAYVTEVEAAVPLAPDIQPDDLIVKERYAHFLAKTKLDDRFPGLDLSMSVPGNYRVLEEQIGAHQAWVEQQSGEWLTYADAAARWYQQVYWPVIQLIRKRGILRDFPERTETDLYVWIDKHREELARQLGWSINTHQVVQELSDRQAAEGETVVQKLGKMLLDTMTPAVLEAGPTVGEWRQSWLDTYDEEHLFNHILVAIDGQEAGWTALEQALRLAKLDGGALFGLHVVSSLAEIETARVGAIKAEFEKRCREATLVGEISFTTGPTTDTICYRARWADVVVVSLSHPPGPKPVDRLGSQFAQLLRSCPRPVLAVPRSAAGFQRLLLAYDGSPKANEALFIARYMVERWNAALLVITIDEGKEAEQDASGRARRYLEEHGVPALYLREQGQPAPVILDKAREHECDLILMGGYGSQPLSAIVAGSVVDEVLRTRNRPVLVCR